MKCSKCGNIVSETDKFCSNCGAPIIVDNSFNVNNSQQESVNSNPFNSNNYNSNISKRKTKPWVIVLIIISTILLFLILIGVYAYFTYDVLVCKYSDGDITIVYSDKKLVSYMTHGMGYEWEEQRNLAKKIGTDAYIKEFTEWFSKNTTGSCTINGKKVVVNNNNNNNSYNNYNNNNNNYNNNNSYNNNINSNTKRVGDVKHGYVSVPNNWNRFYDPRNFSIFQYAYGNLYIVTMETYEKNYSAKDLATNIYNDLKKSTEITNLTGSTLLIGRDKKYTAYQIYMYYPAQNSYLITYYFEAEDGLVHYIALEGPREVNDKKLSDFMFIPESYSLKD